MVSYWKNLFASMMGPSGGSVCSSWRGRAEVGSRAYGPSDGSRTFPNEQKHGIRTPWVPVNLRVATRGCRGIMARGRARVVLPPRQPRSRDATQRDDCRAHRAEREHRPPALLPPRQILGSSPELRGVPLHVFARRYAYLTRGSRAPSRPCVLRSSPRRCSVPKASAGAARPRAEMVLRGGPDPVMEVRDSYLWRWDWGKRQLYVQRPGARGTGSRVTGLGAY